MNRMTAQPDGTGALDLDGEHIDLSTDSIETTRAQLMKRVVAHAAEQRASVPMTAEDATGTWHLLVHPNGEVEQVDAPAEHLPNPFAQTFIKPHHAEPVAPTTSGGFLRSLFGMNEPNEAERAEAADKHAVAHVWTLPKNIAVANPKGGCGKTPTTICLAAMFARFGGGMVLAQDNNVTRGTLGWRTESARHGATMADLRAELDALTGTERAADMARFTHHQTGDRFDVLQSVPKKLSTDQALTDDEFDQVQQLLARFYRMTIFDSGNDESASMWLRMIHHADALVVPTSTAPDRLETASLMLAELAEQGGHAAFLARNAVVVVMHASTNEPAPERIVPLFKGARAVLPIPHDPAMASNWLRWDSLAPATQRAWLTVGAAVARGLED